MINGLKMIQYNIEEVEPGMILARSVVLPNGELMLAAGKALQSQFIFRLKKLGISHIFIEIPGTEDVNPQKIITTQIEREIASRLITSEKNLQAILDMKTYSQKKIVDLIHEEKDHINEFLTRSGFVETINTIVEQILGYPDVIVNLASMEKKASFLFEHALRVTIMSLCLAKKYNFTEEEMRQLALGAINADLGLIAVPREIVTRNTKLAGDDMKIFKKHVHYGYMILSQNPAIPSTSASVAYQHHECQDGSGYPKGLKGENRAPSKSLHRYGVIHRFSEIVTVADKFDVMVEGRSPYGFKLSRKEAMKILFLSAKEKLNSEIVLAFSKITPIYPIGTRIKIIKAKAARYLGYFGAVVGDNPESFDKPKIVIYETRFRKQMKPFVVDLSDENDFEIEAVL